LKDSQYTVEQITGEKIYLENMSEQMINVVRDMGAYQMTYEDGLIRQIECVNERQMTQSLQELNQLGFIFIGGLAGYPAADMKDYEYGQEFKWKCL